MHHGVRKATAVPLATAVAMAGPWTAWLATRRHLRLLWARLRQDGQLPSPSALGATADDAVVLELAALVLLLGACWLAAGAVAGLLEALTGSAPAVLRTVTPEAVRRVVVLTCGLALGTTSSGLTARAAAPALPPPELGGPALGRPAPGRPAAPATDVLAGLALPERQVGEVIPGPPVEAARDTSGRTVVVRPGDSLWRIGEELLPSGAGTARLDRAWRLLYATNRDRIGADPDLVHPGTTLRLPLPLHTDRSAHHHTRREAP